MRVPALVVSAYTPKGSLCHTLFDHASVPATLEALFSLPALTERDKAADNLTALVSLPVARTDTPVTLPDPAPPDAAPVALAAGQPPPKNDADPVDGGNLPGFLHIVMKGELENEVPGNRMMLMDKVSTTIKTRGDARDYLENKLPGLF